MFEAIDNEPMDNRFRRPQVKAGAQPQRAERAEPGGMRPVPGERDVTSRTVPGGHEIFKRGNQQLELLISDKTVEKIMGPEPVPSLDIEVPMIANELQRKMVEEL